MEFGTYRGMDLKGMDRAHREKLLWPGVFAYCKMYIPLPDGVVFGGTFVTGFGLDDGPTTEKEVQYEDMVRDVARRILPEVASVDDTDVMATIRAAFAREMARR